MHIIVVGGGIIGATTAHACLRRGHEVTLLEAGDALAGGTSYANGGQIAVDEPVRDAADIERADGASVVHRLETDETEGLRPAARHREDLRVGVVARELGVLHPAREVDAVIETERGVMKAS